MATWRPRGEICPVCGGEGQESTSSSAVICRDCEARVVDWAGRPIDMKNTSLLGTNIRVSNGEDGVIDDDTPSSSMEALAGLGKLVSPRIGFPRFSNTGPKALG